jgi:RHS repeat-associated protein
MTSENGSSVYQGLDNQVLYDGTYQYTYDNNGNLIEQVGAGVTINYTWDDHNRLTEMTDQSSAGTTTAIYTYDAQNNRIGEVDINSGTATTYDYVYDGSDLVAMLNVTSGAGSATGTQYLTDPNSQTPLAQENSSGTVSWLLPDQNGSVQDVVNDSAGNVDHVVFDPYGNKIVQDTTLSMASVFGFQGMIQSLTTATFINGSSPVLYDNARYYSPIIGEFLSQDPARQGTNYYEADGDDPITNEDPTGLMSGTDFVGSAIGSSDSNDLLNTPASQLLSFSPTAGSADAGSDTGFLSGSGLDGDFQQMNSVLSAGDKAADQDVDSAVAAGANPYGDAAAQPSINWNLNVDYNALDGAYMSLNRSQDILNIVSNLNSRIQYYQTTNSDAGALSYYQNQLTLWKQAFVQMGQSGLGEEVAAYQNGWDEGTAQAALTDVNGLQNTAIQTANTAIFVANANLSDALPLDGNGVISTIPTSNWAQGYLYNQSDWEYKTNAFLGGQGLFTLATAGAGLFGDAASISSDALDTGGLFGNAAESEGTTTLYHGTSRYAAMEMVDNQGVNIERLAAHQADKSFASGLYTTSQEATANYYADLSFGYGRAGGPAIVKIEVPTSQLNDFLSTNNLSFETPVPRMPGQTETFIPMQNLPDFNNLDLNVSIHK